MKRLVMMWLFTVLAGISVAATPSAVLLQVRCEKGAKDNVVDPGGVHDPRTKTAQSENGDGQTKILTSIEMLAVPGQPFLTTVSTDNRKTSLSGALELKDGKYEVTLSVEQATAMTPPNGGVRILVGSTSIRSSIAIDMKKDVLLSRSEAGGIQTTWWVRIAECESAPTGRLDKTIGKRGEHAVKKGAD